MLFEKSTYSEDMKRVHVADECEAANTGEPIDMGAVDENENIDGHGPFRSYAGARASRRSLRLPSMQATGAIAQLRVR